MKLAMQMTLDGLVRALRQRAHALAEEIEADARPEEATARRPEQRAVETETSDARGRD